MDSTLSVTCSRRVDVRHGGTLYRFGLPDRGGRVVTSAASPWGHVNRMQRDTDLKVWERSHALALEVYRHTERFPSTERYGLVAQVRRAAVSVPSNIAEGSKRLSAKEFARFLNIAEGSLAEAGYLLLLRRDLGYLDAGAATKLSTEVEEIGRMLDALRTKVEGSA